MGQQSIFGRIAQLTKANINALLDSAEDPEKMLDQMVRDYTNNIGEAEEAVAQTIGNLRMHRGGLQGGSRDGGGVGREGAAAARKGQELRAGGNTAEADKFDNLAGSRSKKQIDFERRGQGARTEHRRSRPRSSTSSRPASRA